MLRVLRVLRVSGSRRGKYALSSSLAVDAEVLMARFVAKTLRAGSGLVVQTYCTWGQRLLLLSLER